MTAAPHENAVRDSTAPYEHAMRHALSLASRGPVTGGNPQVGCVLLSPDGEIVAEGWHRGAGTPHAEVDALSKVDDARGLTAVVTLEPCNHHGRTGPCSVALIVAGVARVVYAVDDPGRASSGGATHLRNAGVDVVPGVLADEAETFLTKWLTATRRGTPWVTLKWAASLDGRSAAADGSSQWITGTAARQLVHEQRAESDAILVGTGTVIADDPSLTARGDAGELLAHQPLPVVVGERPVPEGAKLREREFVAAHSRDLEEVLRDLYGRGIRRAYVEGGPTLASAFVRAGLVDEFLVFVAPKLIGGPRIAVDDLGIGSIDEAIPLTFTGVEALGDDILITAVPATKVEE
ncbi:diaminohydroxyphosphoribosylaminopyrimidine deaminase/5-amino-6-(5-phosphoribosylamino)uracil reductase [Microbacteriaceae bacterium SG_E_30_P1]|uniref:Riboflavin biosynthesis protein RibD n=1 Tax=Antiquaquibacter oligotrophicus TaxID=2880260 RepID=A0ABT6KP63_9MICO|nr:bifunctional diaminohydroxyphosphoribosylaminopyrimidine deaminase/5-amino-6-(5-phosphoribosylamino)uracil reductase RibD [Antiquaquibacter oligotrophicus]MDH6181785.1 diaminohydroxyphosphoribosylaminopyrimidine deaminase/5-amino-6-(5-phosphoribosylamino)uracil reductase [Antiquaquibacter oligotrophicus]UDF12535.1 bifunctional diaminohydroxyphosphoribosylaminopyrimidine deaminase/5-amino-6-(5-phosphoribosylamino)uracil reductase RibD [Antiquaquibacter oligotrophicus]